MKFKLNCDSFHLPVAPLVIIFQVLALKCNMYVKEERWRTSSFTSHYCNENLHAVCGHML